MEGKSNANIYIKVIAQGDERELTGAYFASGRLFQATSGTFDKSPEYLTAISP